MKKYSKIVKEFLFVVTLLLLLLLLLLPQWKSLLYFFYHVKNLLHYIYKIGESQYIKSGNKSEK